MSAVSVFIFLSSPSLEILPCQGREWLGLLNHGGYKPEHAGSRVFHGARSQPTPTYRPDRVQQLWTQAVDLTREEYFHRGPACGTQPIKKLLRVHGLVPEPIAQRFVRHP
jgi:hypothetical protein